MNEHPHSIAPHESYPHGRLAALQVHGPRFLPRALALPIGIAAPVASTDFTAATAAPTAAAAAPRWLGGPGEVLVRYLVTRRVLGMGTATHFDALGIAANGKTVRVKIHNYIKNTINLPAYLREIIHD